MGKAKSALESQVRMLRRALEFVSKVKSRINLIDVYVVGSRARGDYRDDSDIDIVIISNDVEGLNHLRRRELLTDLLEPGIEFF
ncbi:MAG: nucleotidyltransferase domain-containing protein, partial [Caldivirga sp.]